MRGRVVRANDPVTACRDRAFGSLSLMLEIPARSGAAARIGAGQRLRVVNTHGNQVVDFWAFVAADPREHLSMEASRTSLSRIIPRVGDTLVTNNRRPILKLVEDTSPGIHDTLIAACDRYRYELLDAPGHANCSDNLHAALEDLGVTVAGTPAPLNLWMNIPVAADNSLSFLPTVAKPGDHVVFEALCDAIVAFSACPQDIIPVNDGSPVEAHFEVIS